MSEPIKNRYDFVFYFDVENGNPNGDPDAGNMPRIDTENNHGFVTDVCLKRKVRNYVNLVKGGDEGYEMYIQQDAPLEVVDKRAQEALKNSAAKIKNSKSAERDSFIRGFMCKTFFDIRAFGAVMTSYTSSAGYNCGQVRGPIQLNFAKSVDPIDPQDITLTRMAITKQSKFNEANTEIGHKYVIPYALYRCEGYVSASFASQERKGTGFSEEDLELFWEAIINMFEHDHSAARGKMVVRNLTVFKHDSELGNAPSHKLFDLVSTQKREGVLAPRSFADYEPITVDESAIPEGVTVISMV